MENDFGRRPKKKNDFSFRLGALKSQLDSITLDKKTLHILNTTRMKLRIEINADNQVAVFLLDESTDERVGVLSDLERIAKVREFVAAEANMERAIQLIEEVEKAIVRLLPRIREKDPTFSLKEFKPDQISVFKEIGRDLGFLKRNREYIRRSLLSDDLAIRKCATLLEAWMTSSEECLVKTIEKIILGAPHKRHVKPFLLESGVPFWAHKFLTRRTIDVYPDVRRILFPNDASNGIKLSVEEWTHPGFIRLNEFLVSNSGFVMKLLSDSKILRKILKMDERVVPYTLPNTKPEHFKNLLQLEVLVVPLYFGLGYYLSPGILGKETHFPNRSKISDLSTFFKDLVEVFVKVQSLNGIFDSQEGDFWKPLLEGIDVDLDPPNRKLRNFYSIVNEHHSITARRLKVFALGANGDARKLLRKCMKSELRLPNTSDEYKLLEEILPDGETWENTDAHSLTRDANLIREIEKYSNSEWSDLVRTPLRPDEVVKLEPIRDMIGLRKKSDQREDVRKLQDRDAISELTKESRSALARFTKNRALKPLVPGMEAFLRSFIFDNMQHAALNELIVALENTREEELLPIDRMSNPDLDTPAEQPASE